jgi:hypothetical protein
VGSGIHAGIWLKAGAARHSPAKIAKRRCMQKLPCRKRQCIIPPEVPREKDTSEPPLASAAGSRM